jgi:sulfate adenylyltransferase subunit 1
MDHKELVPGSKYFLQHRSKLIKTVVKEIDYKLDVNSLEKTPTDSVKLNEVVSVTLKTASPIVFDSFEKNKGTGSAILVDETSNATVGAVMIL